MLSHSCPSKHPSVLFCARYAAVDIGYEEGLYQSLLPYTRYTTTLSDPLNIHPTEKARCRYIRRKMEANIDISGASMGIES